MLEFLKYFRLFYMRMKLEKYCKKYMPKCWECKLHHQCGFRFSEEDLIRCYKIVFGRRRKQCLKSMV